MSFYQKIRPERVCGLLFFIFLWSSNAFGQAQTDVVEVRVDGMVRHALVHDPVPNGARKKVVMVFHGGGMNMYLMKDQLRNAIATYDDYLFVFMQAPNSELSTPCGASQLLVQAWQVGAPYIAIRCGINADVKYTDATKDYVLANYNVHEDSLYAFGYSSGGFYTFSLAMIAPHVFRKFAVFGSVSNYYVNHSSYNCNDSFRQLVLSTNRLEGFSPPSLPNLNKPTPAKRTRLYYIVSPDDATIDGLVRAGFRHPLFAPQVMDDSWFRITFLELLYRNTSRDLLAAHSDFTAFHNSISTLSPPQMHSEEYGPSGNPKVKVDVFRTAGDGHLMASYPGGKVALMQNVIDFFER